MGDFGREGDVTKLSDCQQAVVGVDFVLHQAALGSVPRSVSDPLATNSANINGFLNMLVASRDAQVRSFTYAQVALLMAIIGLCQKRRKYREPIVSLRSYKIRQRIICAVFSRTYGFKSIGLRYFKVFGKRQDPNGTYAAVIQSGPQHDCRRNRIYKWRWTY